MNRKWFSMFSIKIIASFTMVLDHIGCIFFNQYEYPVPNGVLRAIGRIAFILYAFCLAEGFEHTKSRKQYAIRLMVAAILVEPVFNLVFIKDISKYLSEQNVIFTFFISFCTMYVVDYIRHSERIRLKVVLIVCTVIVGMLVAELIRSEYGCMGVGLVLTYYFLRGKKVVLFITSFLTYAFGVFVVNKISHLIDLYGIYMDKVKRYTELGEEILLKNTKFGWEQISSAFKVTSDDVSYFLRMCIAGPVIALLIIMLYTGKKGKSIPRLAFYIFYPAHMLILWNIWMLMTYALPK